jgi:hypothetical protein
MARLIRSWHLIIRPLAQFKSHRLFLAVKGICFRRVINLLNKFDATTVDKRPDVLFEIPAFRAWYFRCYTERKTDSSSNSDGGVLGRLRSFAKVSFRRSIGKGRKSSPSTSIKSNAQSTAVWSAAGPTTSAPKTSSILSGEQLTDARWREA